MMNHRFGIAAAVAFSLLLAASAGVTAPTGAVSASTPSAITTTDIGQAGALTLTMTDQTADSDTCSFSNGPVTEDCQGFLDSPVGGTQQGGGTFAGTLTATVPITSTDGLQTPATGTGPWTETVTADSSTVTAIGVPSNLGIGFGGDQGDCGLVSARSDEAYQGSTVPGSYNVSGLQAVTGDTGAVTDLSLAVDDTTAPPPADDMRETDTLISAQYPDRPGCSAGTVHTFDHLGWQGEENYITGAPESLYGLPPGVTGMTGWTIDPSGTWTPETGGVLAEKRLTVSTPEDAPDTGTITNNYLFQLVTGVCAGNSAARLATASACGLVADAGGPYSPVRAASFTLDGSKSKDLSGHRITEWKWTWAPGDNCRPNTALTNDSKTGEQVTIKALCDLKVRLTVTNDASPPEQKYEDVYVSVKARPGYDKTPASYQLGPKGHAGTPTDQPLATGNWTAGRNVSACDSRPEHLDDELCPAPVNGSYQDHGYTTGLLDDPGGPFDLFPFVTPADPSKAATDLSVDTIGLLNPYILRGGPIPAGACPRPRALTCMDMYAYNKLHGGQVDAYIAALKEHEGTGAPGKPLTGHASAAKAAATMDKGNVRKMLEDSIGLRAADGQFVPYLDREANGANDFIADYANAADSHPIGTYKIYLWRPPKGRTPGAWVLVQDTV